MRRLKLLLILWLIMTSMYSQRKYKEAIWMPMSLNGFVELFGQYASENRTSVNGFESIENKLFSGGLSAHSQSYIWHPNFLVLDISGIYRPSQEKEISILSPDYSIKSVSKSVSLGMNFFRRKKITFQTLVSYDNGHMNMENIFQTKFEAFDWGGKLTYSNKWLPITLHFSRKKGTTTDQIFDRMYKLKSSDLGFNTKKSFFRYNENVLDVLFSDTYSELINGFKIDNKSMFLNLNNSYKYYDKVKFQSRANRIYQEGTFPIDRLNINENITVKLPWNYSFEGNYGYLETVANDLTNYSNSFNGTILHQWYSSLKSTLSYERLLAKNILFNESRSKLMFGLDYSKKIALNGRLSIGYNFSMNNHHQEIKESEFQVLMEPHFLTDGEIEFLEFPNVDISTILVRDETGGIIYQENIDYIIIEHDSAIEIQRLPGGMIANNTQVYVDYLSINRSSFKSDFNTHIINTNLSLFNNIFQVFYRHSLIDINSEQMMNNANYIRNLDMETYGLGLKYKLASAGIEKINYKSELLPMESVRYYMNLSGSPFPKFNVTLNGVYMDRKYKREDINFINRYYNAFGNISYQLNYRTSISMGVNFRKQDGEGLDLEAINGRLELTTRYRQLHFRIMAEYFDREYLKDEKQEFKGVKLIIRRRF